MSNIFYYTVKEFASQRNLEEETLSFQKHSKKRKEKGDVDKVEQDAFQAVCNTFVLQAPNLPESDRLMKAVLLHASPVLCPFFPDTLAKVLPGHCASSRQWETGKVTF